MKITKVNNIEYSKPNATNFKALYMIGTQLRNNNENTVNQQQI